MSPEARTKLHQTEQPATALAAAAQTDGQGLKSEHRRREQRRDHGGRSNGRGGNDGGRSDDGAAGANGPTSGRRSSGGPSSCTRAWRKGITTLAVATTGTDNSTQQLSQNEDVRTSEDDGLQC